MPRRSKRSARSSLAEPEERLAGLVREKLRQASSTAEKVAEDDTTGRGVSSYFT